MIADDGLPNRCFLCPVSDPSSLQTCPDCGSVKYCSRGHYDLHKVPQWFWGTRKLAKGCQRSPCHRDPVEDGAGAEVGGVQEVGQQTAPGNPRCLPFMVLFSEDRGRYLVATRDIGAGETVLVDPPLAQGPLSKSLPCCLQCSRPLQTSDDLHACTKCGLPLCSQSCESGTVHQPECRFFSSARSGIENRIRRHDDAVVEDDLNDSDPDGMEPSPPAAKLQGFLKSLTVSDFRAPSQLFSCILTLRLLLKFRNPDQHDKARVEVAGSLLDHEAERRRDAKAWMANEILVVNYIRNMAGFIDDDGTRPTPLPTAGEVHRMMGLLKTNGVKVEANGFRGQSPRMALYPVYSLTNHSCIGANTRTVKAEAHGSNVTNRGMKLGHICPRCISLEVVLELKSTLPIRKGEQIFTRYTTPQLNTLKRQFLLQSNWYFSCDCRRCLDPTECGTMANAIRCPKEGCRGYLLPLKPSNLDSAWVCDSRTSSSSLDGESHHTVGPQVAQKVTASVEVLTKLAEASQAPIRNLELLLERFAGSHLHPDNSNLIAIREKIIKAVITRRRKLAAALALAAKRDVEPAEAENSRSEIVRLWDLQITHFQEVARVMAVLDLPSEFWHSMAAKMVRDRNRAIEQLLHEDEYDANPSSSPSLASEAT